MKKTTITRITAAMLSGVMAFSLAACGPKEKPQEDNKPQKQTQTDGKLFSEPTTIKVAISSSSTWPYDEKWKMWEYFREGTGADFKVQAIPDSDISTKISLMLTSQDTMPDMLYMDGKTQADLYTDSGAFVSLSDNFAKLPNMTKFLDTLPEENRNELLSQRLSGDGKIYCAPLYGTHTIQNLRSWMYRKDIFDKHGLAAPNSMDEVYETAKKLKKLYPNSYPVCIRDAMWQFDPMGPQWKPNMCLHTYYDFQNKKWCYGAQQPEMKEMVEYFLKLYKEQLVPPDYVNITTKAWEELVSTDRAFMMLEYIVRIDFFNQINRKANPDYTWAIMEPPMVETKTKTGQRKLGKTNIDSRGYVICNTGNEKQIENSFKVLDWMYSDEGSELLSWGKEGETYEVIDGKKRFILPNKDQSALQAYGVATTGLCQRIAVEANEAAYSDEQAEQGHIAIKWNEVNTNPTKWMPFDASVKAEVAALDTDLMNFTREMISKFMIDKKPMSEWDSFQKDLKEMGVEKLLQFHEEAYQKVAKADFKW